MAASDDALEPSSEPPAAGGTIASLRAAAEAALPRIRAILEDRGVLPQQALGALGIVADVINRVLVNINDPAALTKFGRVKVSALRKKIPKAPELAEAVLQAAGFRRSPDDPDRLEWGPTAEDALAPSLAVLVLISRLQERAQASGLRALAEPLDANVGLSDVLAISYGGVRLLEPRAAAMGGSGNMQTAGTVQGFHVTRAWLRERLPLLADAMEEFHALFDPGAREKALCRSIARTVSEVRAARGLGDAAKLVASTTLGDVAQLIASAALVDLRKPGILNDLPAAGPEAVAAVEPEEEEAAVEALSDAKALEPDGEPGAEASTEVATVELSAETQMWVKASSSRLVSAKLTGAGAAGRIIPVILGCVPATWVNNPLRAFNHRPGMREAPAYFTSGLREKQFEVGLAALSNQIVEQWLKQPSGAAPLLSPETSAIGVGCSLDVRDDDKAIIFAILV